MRAAKWRLEEGKERMKATVEWRREVRPDLISADEVRCMSFFSILGEVLLGGRPGPHCVYLLNDFLSFLIGES
jgi:hypothetical protein